MRIELVHLAALAGVAEHGSFVGAAARLGVEATMVSRRIASLEDIVGAPLVDRGQGGGPATLTAAGKLVLDHAERIAAALRGVDDALDGSG